MPKSTSRCSKLRVSLFEALMTAMFVQDDPGSEVSSDRKTTTSRLAKRQRHHFVEVAWYGGNGCPPTEPKDCFKLWKSADRGHTLCQNTAFSCSPQLRV